MSLEVVNLVVTCTARKTVPVPEPLLMRNVRTDALDRRFKEWGERLAGMNLDRRRVADFYCGNSWSVIRNLASAEDLSVKLRIWVISAGHGLVSFEDSLTPYSATFAPGEEDSVVPPELDSHPISEWWELLAGWRRESKASVACLADIARCHPRTPLVAAVSSVYLKAVARDLEEARSALADRDYLTIISAGSRKSGSLSSNILPCDSRLEHLYGKSRMALNARILRSVVHGFAAKDIRASHLATHFEALLAPLPAAIYPSRLVTDDETVRHFIRSEVEKNGRSGHTSLLRQYRASGRACEQKRFRSLYLELAKDTHHTGRIHET